MRTRAWRKFQEEKFFIKRLKRFNYHGWFYFETANGDLLPKPRWIDYIGRPDFNYLKNDKVKDSRYNDKYSPNRRHKYYRDPKPRRGCQSTGKREKDKILTRKLIKEYYEYRRDYPQE
jgi:hypothetical protein